MSRPAQNIPQGLESETVKQSGIDAFADLMSSVCLEYKIDLNTLFALAKQKLIREGRKVYFPESQVKLSAHLRMDRRDVGYILANNVPIKINRIEILKKRILQFFIDKKTTRIKRVGETNSFEYFCKETVNTGYTIASVLSVFKSCDFLIEKNDGYLYFDRDSFLDHSRKLNKDLLEITEMFSKEMDKKEKTSSPYFKLAEPEDQKLDYDLDDFIRERILDTISRLDSLVSQKVE